MFLTSFSVLIPVLFVMGLGYWAGRTKRFDADQINGLNELVMVYAMPALMFVAAVTTRRSEMLAEAPFLAGLLVAFLGLFIVVVVVSVFVLHHSVGEAALQASLITFPSIAFFGVPIFKGIFGPASLLSIASATVLASITILPLTIVLLEIGAQHSANKTNQQPQGIVTLILQGLLTSFKKPMVWAPLLGAVIVLLDIDFPTEIDAMLSLIGSTTGGASLFLAGLVIASYSVKLNREILVNVLGKMVLQPALMAALVVPFAIHNPLGREAILICAIPATSVLPIFAARYKVYETETSSTVVIDSVLMLITFTLTVLLVDA